MSRFIDADVLKKQMLKYGFHSEDQTVTEFVEDTLPTADVVEVVRCEDCRYWDNRLDVMVCNLTDGMKGASDYCSFGERREDG